MSQRYEIAQRLRPAMLALRDTEDWARLELGDDLLAQRIREVHEALTSDVLNGRTSVHTTSWKARLWDRYCLIRGHDANAGAGRVALSNRQRQRKEVRHG